MRRIFSLSFNQQYYAQNLARIGLGINQKYAAIELSYNNTLRPHPTVGECRSPPLGGDSARALPDGYGSSAAVVIVLDQFLLCVEAFIPPVSEWDNHIFHIGTTMYFHNPAIAMTIIKISAPV